MGEPKGARLAKECDALEDVLRGLRPETGQLGQPAIEGRRLQLGQGIDIEHLVDLTDLGDAEPGDGEHLDQAGRDLFPKLFEHAGATGVDQFGDDLEGRRPDALRRGERSILQSVSQVAREAPDRPRGGSEGADPERVFALELEKGGDLLQDLGHRLLVHEALDALHG